MKLNVLLSSKITQINSYIFRKIRSCSIQFNLNVNETMAINTATNKGKKSKKKMTKEERRAKYTKIAHQRRDSKIDHMKNKNVVCFRCRKKGHTASECTFKFVDGDNNNDNDNNNESNLIRAPSNLCFRCGSTDHRLNACPKRNKKGDANDELPFAKCFVCGEMGHISSQCSRNKNGIYVNGGCCRNCGSKDHLASKCPNTNKSLGGVDDCTDDDDDGNSALVCQVASNRDNPDEILDEQEVSAKRKRKVVNF